MSTLAEITMSYRQVDDLIQAVWVFAIGVPLGLIAIAAAIFVSRNRK
jgi:hypothetical protein